MEEGSAQRQQHLHQQLVMQQQQQKQLLLLQQLQQQQAAAHLSAVSRFPSNIDAHLRTPGGALLRPPVSLQNQHATPPPQQIHQQIQKQPPPPPQHQHQQPNQQQQQQTKLIGRGHCSQKELEMAHQDAWQVCHPDIKRPFSSLEDACERLLPYHVVADYEAEEDDKILDSDTTGQMPSRSQQWDNTIAAKVAEFITAFEKQVLAFNIISHKRAQGEFRSEERLMIEQALLQMERHALLTVRAEMEREKADQEAKMRMAAAQVDQAQAEVKAQSQADKMVACAPVRSSMVGSHAEGVLSHNVGIQEGVNMDDVLRGWGGGQKEDDDQQEDFLNDGNEHEAIDGGIQGEWREVGVLDLNTLNSR